ncbi:hypothetical protein ABEV74_02745, partial [Paenibacillus cisolokensis]|uniref:hypothetical protein n=1 Tax=Paenibacillus cisolokensis TaxID=1658519 RepID=UPI003D2DB242
MAFALAQLHQASGKLTASPSVAVSHVQIHFLSADHKKTSNIIEFVPECCEPQGSFVSEVCEGIFDKFTRLKTNIAKVQFFSGIKSRNAQISAIIPLALHQT